MSDMTKDDHWYGCVKHEWWESRKTWEPELPCPACQALAQLSTATALIWRLIEWHSEEHSGMHMTSRLQLEQIVADAEAFVEAAEGNPSARR